MMRLDALRAIYPRARRARRRHDHGRRAGRAAVARPPPDFFYLEHAMGLASSMGLGIALGAARAAGRRVRRRRLGADEPRRPSRRSRATGRATSSTSSSTTRSCSRSAELPHRDVHRQRPRRHRRRRRACRARRPCRTRGRVARAPSPRRSPPRELADDGRQGRAGGAVELRHRSPLLENRFQFQRHLRSGSTAQPRADREDESPDEQSSSQLVAELDAGRIRVVDLTQPLGAGDAGHRPAAEFAASPGVTIEVHLALRRQGAGRGTGTSLHLGEHTGTHFDAPVHWITGKDLPDNACDTIPRRPLRRAGLRDRRHAPRWRRTRTSC